MYDISNPLHREYLRLLEKFQLKPQVDHKIFDQYEKLIQLIKNSENHTIKAYFKRTYDVIEMAANSAGENINNLVQDAGIFDGTGRLYKYSKIIIKHIHKEQLPLKQNLYFNTFPTYEMNACAIQTKSGIIILLNSGLLKFIYSISYSVCHLVRSTPNGILYTLELESPCKKYEKLAIVKTVKTIFNYIIGGKNDSLIITEGYMSIWGHFVANAISFAIKTFVMGHEIAHSVLGHLAKTETTLFITPNGNLDVLNISRKNEFEADLWAQDILFNNDLMNPNAFPIIGGGLAFFIIQIMIYKVIEKIEPEKSTKFFKSSSHPTIFERTDYLNNFLMTKANKFHNTDWIAPYVVFRRVLELIERAEIRFKNGILDIIPK